MVMVLKKGVVFESDSRNIYTIALARSGALEFDDSLASFTANYALSKMPVTPSTFMNEFVGVCFSSDRLAIGRIFKVFNTEKSEFIGMFEVRQPVKLGELFTDAASATLARLLEKLEDRNIVAIPEETVGVEIAGKLLSLQEYPLLRPVQPRR
ncbi:MAG: hypothetical protein QXW10_01550 [Candidatus Micrarchaeaceae archaeon]